MGDVIGAHNGLHSEQGARSGEHAGRSQNPIIKVADLAWLEFEKPDLVRAEAFAQAFVAVLHLPVRQRLSIRRRVAAPRHRRRWPLCDHPSRCHHPIPWSGVRGRR